MFTDTQRNARHMTCNHATWNHTNSVGQGTHVKTEKKTSKIIPCVIENSRGRKWGEKEGWWSRRFESEECKEEYRRAGFCLDGHLKPGRVACGYRGSEERIYHVLREAAQVTTLWKTHWMEKHQLPFRLWEFLWKLELSKNGNTTAHPKSWVQCTKWLGCIYITKTL